MTPSRRSFASTLALATLGAGTLGPGIAATSFVARSAAAQDLALEARAAANAWLAGLSEAARGRALLPFESDQRRDWNYTPRSRPGVTLAELGEPGRQALMRLLRTVLSEEGIERVEGVLLLKEILGELTSNPGFRDPTNYALTLFGEPANDRPWGFRFEGHHLSLSFTIVPGLGVAVTPHFIGTNPAVVPGGHTHAGFELLRTERTLAFELILSLEGVERERAVLGHSPRDIVTGPGRERSLEGAPEGLPLGGLNQTRQDMAMGIVESFARSLRAPLAEAELEAVRSAGVGAIHFAWAGEAEIGQPHYFRLQGPSLVIEYDDMRGGSHVHAVWHDPTDLLGEDLLRRHHAEATHD